MVDPIKIRPQFDYSNTPGAVPTRPILPGGAAIQQADGTLLTLKSDGSTRTTPLDLGSAATKNIGVNSGTVAAGDDSRIVGIPTAIKNAIDTLKQLGATFAGAVGVSYVSSSASIIYGFFANIKGSGSSTSLVVGDQINAYSVGSGIRSVFGGAREAWSGDLTTSPAATATLIAFETAVISQHDANDQPLVGQDFPFKNRADGATAPLNGLGSNGYNKFSRALQVSSQPRSTSGEYCGWTTGLLFQANSLDRSATTLAVGIDMSAVDYSRMASAFRFPANGKMTWDGDARQIGITSGSLVYSVSGSNVFSVNSSGDITVVGAVQMPTNGKFNWDGGARNITVASGSFAYNVSGVTIFSCSSAGVVDIASGGVLRIGAKQIIGARDTAWAPMTGTGNKSTTYDVTTITLPQLAARVAQLQAALATHGLIGP
jgi:hypothetical protein